MSVELKGNVDAKVVASEADVKEVPFLLNLLRSDVGRLESSLDGMWKKLDTVLGVELPVSELAQPDSPMASNVGQQLSEVRSRVCAAIDSLNRLYSRVEL